MRAYILFLTAGYATAAAMAAAATSASTTMPWPIPRGEFSVEGSVVEIDKDSFRVDASASSSGILSRAAERYEDIIKKTVPAPAPAPQCEWETANVACESDQDCQDWVDKNCHPASTVTSYCKTNNFCHFSGSFEENDAISALKITVTSSDETLSSATNESYSIQISGTDASIDAVTVYGAIRGLETFSQLVSIGSLTTNLTVSDEPFAVHRGLMVDTARRFLPLDLLRSLVDGLQFSKLNVLHLHLSDEPAFRMESTLFPELNADIPDKSYYTQSEMRDFISYARDRGVRVVPEIDLPGHAGGLAPLAKTQNVTFCDGDQQTTLASDASTLAVVDKLLSEVASVFSDERVFHFGADEVCKHDVCPAGCNFDDVHAFEEHVQRTLVNLGKTPMGWNDVFSDPKGEEPNAALPGTIVQNWGTKAPTTFAEKNFHVVDSNYRQMYLNQQCCRVVPPTKPGDKYSMCYYRDSAQDMVGTPLARFFEGGETAQWSDNYCPAPECKINGTFGWMYSRSMDAVFSESFSRSVFPGAAAAAGQLWSGYDTNLVPKGLPSDTFVESINAHTTRLNDRGVAACRVGCACDWESSCIGNASAFYGNKKDATPLNQRITLVNRGCDFTVKVRARTPCSTKNGDDLGTLSGMNATFEVVGSDFILVGTTSDKTVKAGDQFSIWVGDSTWMNLVETLYVTCDDTDYIYMDV